MRHAQSQVKDAALADVVRVEQEDALRVHYYRMLAHFLSAPCTSDDLSIAEGLTAQPGTPLGDAVLAVAAAAADTSPATEADAFQDLFIGLGRGIFVPYGSYYLTGFLHEKPLARLRADMAELGIARSEDVAEPEDHISSVLEMMAGLIAGDFGWVPDARRRAFFEAHVGSWAGHFFRDLSLDNTSALYRSLGELGTRFLEVETHALRLE